MAAAAAVAARARARARATEAVAAGAARVVKGREMRSGTAVEDWGVRARAGVGGRAVEVAAEGTAIARAEGG